MRIAHLQPFVPHYREEFFEGLSRRVKQTVYVYKDDRAAGATGCNISATEHKYISNKLMKGGMLLVYNPLPLLRGRYDALVLMLHSGHITTWLLLLTKWLHRRKIILWGQGISVTHYIEQERRPSPVRRLQIALADGVWLYMEKERRQWQAIFPHKPMVALNNTLTGVSFMTSYKPYCTVEELKAKYGISQETVLIFCARFNGLRRTDLLIETIRRLDPQRFAFVIIGGGDLKPNFSPYHNVHDFGPLYDTDIKRELFALSDIYFQPGWVGLSIVEAMAYGKPVFTFRRSRETLQCVEYSYIQHGYNGMILNDIDHCVSTLSGLSQSDISRMSRNARSYVADNLTMEQMIERAMTVVDLVAGEK